MTSFLDRTAIVGRLLLCSAALGLATANAQAASIITDVVETGGDNEATDTIPAKWTGVTFPATVAGEPVAGIAIGTPYTVPPFGEDVPAFVDRNHQWNGATTALPIPPYLLGGEYIMIGNDNRDNLGLQLDITVSEGAYVYLLIDTRLTDGNAADPPESGATPDLWFGMAWLNTEGFAPVVNGLNRAGNLEWPDEVGYDEGGDGVGAGVAINTYASVYWKEVPAGTFSIYQADNAGRNMYGVVIKPLPTSPSAPPVITLQQPANNTMFYSAAGGLQFTAATAAANQLAPENLKLWLNGTDVSSSLTVGGTASSRTASYAGLQANNVYLGRIVVSDQAGRASTNDFRFDTFDAATTIAVDLEDYNYESGKFLDAPAPGAYAALLGTVNIDYHENNTTVPATVNRVGDYVGFAAAADAERAAFTTAGVTDYAVTAIGAGDWLNYTRTFAANTYQVYLRASSTVPQLLRLDRITGDRTTVDQVPVAAGVFDFPNTAGPTAYTFVPLTDAAGVPVVLNLSGVATFRLTALTANYNLQANMLLFVPTPGAARPAYLAAASPGPNAAGVPVDASLRLTVMNGSSPVVDTGASLVFNGANVTAAAALVPVAEGALVTYDPPGYLLPATTYPVQLIFADAGGTFYTNEWSFTTAAAIPVIPGNYGTAPGTGQGDGLNFKIRKAPNTDSFGTAFTMATTVDRTEQHLADLILDPETGVAYANEAGGPSGNGLGTTTLVNYMQTAATAGYFAGDVAFPYVDLGVTPDPNNMAMELTTYLELTPGIHRFGVRSDDGFRVASGPAFSRMDLVLGQLNAGRGDGLPGGATEFEVLVEAAGVYPIRLIWCEGAGGASLEFYSVNRTTWERTLINDRSNAQSVKAYLSRPAVVFLPTVAITSPADKQVFPDAPATITINATAAVTDSTITVVEFFAGATKIGEDTTAPYSIVWANAARGGYALTAKATAATGLSTVSAPVNVSVDPLILDVVETGGDNEPTDTILAKWSGVTFAATVAGEPVPGIAVGAPYTVPLFGEDVPCFVDRNHQWNGATAALPLPSYLVGGEYIMSGNDNRDNFLQMDITLSEPAIVYMLVDTRLSDGVADDPPEAGLPLDQWLGMAWLNTEGFVPVLNGLNRAGNMAWPDEVGYDEGADGVGPGVGINTYASIYKKEVPAGTFSIYQADNSGRNMYGVVIKRPVTEPPVLAKPILSNGQITITWTGGGKLQQAPAVTGSWADVPGNPQGTVTLPASGAAGFFRVIAP